MYFPIENGDFPLLCGFTRVYLFFQMGLFLLLPTSYPLWNLDLFADVSLLQILRLWIHHNWGGWQLLNMFFSCSPLFGEDEPTHFDEHFFSDGLGNQPPTSQGEDGFTFLQQILAFPYVPFTLDLVACWGYEGDEILPRYVRIMIQPCYTRIPIKQQRNKGYFGCV